MLFAAEGVKINDPKELVKEELYTFTPEELVKAKMLVCRINIENETVVILLSSSSCHNIFYLIDTCVE